MFGRFGSSVCVGRVCCLCLAVLLVTLCVCVWQCRLLRCRVRLCVCVRVLLYVWCDSVCLCLVSVVWMRVIFGFRFCDVSLCVFIRFCVVLCSVVAGLQLCVWVSLRLRFVLFVSVYLDSDLPFCLCEFRFYNTAFWLGFVSTESRIVAFGLGWASFAPGFWNCKARDTRHWIGTVFGSLFHRLWIWTKNDKNKNKNN